MGADFIAKKEKYRFIHGLLYRWSLTSDILLLELQIYISDIQRYRYISVLSCDIDISAVYSFLQPTAAKVSISGHIDTQYLSLVLTVILRLSKIFSFTLCSLRPRKVTKWSRMANNHFGLVQTVIFRLNMPRSINYFYKI